MAINGERWGVFRHALGAAVRAHRASSRSQDVSSKPRLVGDRDRAGALVAALQQFGDQDDLPPDGPNPDVFEASVASCWLDNVAAPFNRIVFGADGEDLAEEFVEEWLACMAPALAHYGLPLVVETIGTSRGSGEPVPGSEYILLLNEVRCTVWEAAEWDFDASPPWDPWLAATLRPLAVLNRLLDAAGTSSVRAHTVDAGGNDGLVVLIDPKVVEAMRGCGAFSAPEIPLLVGDRSFDEWR